MTLLIDGCGFMEDTGFPFLAPVGQGIKQRASDHMRRIRIRETSRLSVSWLALTLVVLLGLAGCGGGSGGSHLPPPTPDFSLSVNPTSETLNSGSSVSLSLSANPVNGFGSQVTIQISGVPGGVGVSPTNVTLTPGTPQQLTLSATATAPSANAQVTFTGTSGLLTHTANLALTVNGTSNGVPVRTRYLRTDATTEYSLWVNQHWILYHAATGRYFVTDPSSNQIIVIDAASESVIGRIGVPGAFGMDDTPDHSTLYVGTQVGDVYAVDPVAMTVTQRYIASEIGPYGFAASQVLVLADGQLALIGLYNGVDGTGNVALWNPSNNSATVYGGLGGVGLPCNVGTLGGFARTVDRTQVFLGAINGGGLCEFNPTTGASYTVSTGSDLHITTTPDGKYVILPSATNDGVTLFNAQNLAFVSEFSVQGGTGSSSGFVVSADSTTLYVPQETVIYAYDLGTGQQIGWLPNIYVQFTSGGFAFGPITSPYLLATDGSGLFAGPTEEGIGFMDLSKIETGPVGTQFTNGYLNPTTGPTSGGTPTQWSDPNPVGTLESIYFGTNLATSISASSGYIDATTPAGKAGPADVYAFTDDGGMQLLPEAFSYGPTILEVTPNVGTVEGGGTGYIYGYGFGPTTSNTVPSNLTVTVGGAPVPVTGFNGNAYGLAAPPFPLESLAFTIPPGKAAASVDVTVAANSGSTTSTAALTYLPATQQFPLTGAELAQGIYDPYTDLYYFTDATKIQVFSRAQGKWLSPISMPPSAQRLWGIALSPNGSKMAVSDLENGNIYLLSNFDTASPAIQTFSVGSVSQFPDDPCGLAISDSGNVYFMVVVIGQGGGADQFFKLDTANGAIFNYGVDSPGLGSSDAYLRNAISSDNARVFFNDYGYVFNIDTGTDKVFPATEDPSCCYGNYELALSSNQTQFTATNYIYDSDLNNESYYALNDREVLDIAYVYGTKLSPDGRLLFQPSANGIDVFDGNIGNLRERISLPFALSTNYDALVSDGEDNALVAITGTNGNGVAVVDLTSLPEASTSIYDSKSRINANRLLSDRHPLSANSSSNKYHDARGSGVRTILHLTRNWLPSSNPSVNHPRSDRR